MSSGRRRRPGPETGNARQWFGGRRLQRRAIELLQLSAGDTVVDLGTGSGWNLPHLARAVGPQGTVIGVDLSAEMLRRAQKRCRRAGAADVLLMRPFGVRQAYRDIHPWESVARHLEQTVYEEALGGVIYLAAGEASSELSSR